MKVSVKRPLKKGDIVFNVFNGLLMSLVILVTLYPFINTLAISLDQAQDSMKGGIGLWPRVFTLDNYQIILTNVTIYSAFLVSVARTVVTTVFGVFFTAMLSYTLSRRNFFLRKFISVVFIISMYVSAGIIPVYFLMRSLGLINNFLVYVIPYLVTAFNVIICRTFMETIPESIAESAKIDGASDFRVFLQIMIPLCKPVLATVALFIAVDQWNQWFDSYIYCFGNPKLSTLQFELMKLVQSTDSANASSSGVNTFARPVTSMSIRTTITIVATIPVLLIYPFLQKYFVLGMNVGSIKE